MSVSEAPPRKLNFGCGYDKREGYLNVDSDPQCNPDLLIVDNDLSVLERCDFDEILALDVLEHIPRQKTLDVLLEWADLLVDGGTLRLKTSSILGVAAQLDGNPSFRDQYGWTICLFGNQAHPGDFHHTGFTELTLSVYLLAAGFRIDRMWMTDKWLLHAEATKVRSWSSLVERSSELDDEAFLRLAYREILDRDIDEPALGHFLPSLGDGTIDRRSIVQQLASSLERLFLVAHHSGFEGERQRVQAGARFVPPAAKPALRKLAYSARALSTRARRAWGSRRRRTPLN
jgi:hypothetical protein